MRFLQLSAWLAAVFISANLNVMATETPEYKTNEQDGKFELREYPALTMATTTSGDGDFMRLFRYISGGNQEAQKIPMTAPVLINNADEQPSMSFIMPGKMDGQKVPSPREASVKITTMPGGRFAVHRFSGGRNPENEAKALTALRTWMEQKQISAAGEPLFGYYDPPWIPSFLRRNEVMMRVATRP